MHPSGDSDGWRSNRQARSNQERPTIDFIFFDAAWFEIGNVTRLWDETAPFICQLKELTVLGFMLSEVGSKQFLRENPMGSFEGDLPLAKDDSAYAAEMPMRLITRG